MNKRALLITGIVLLFLTGTVYATKFKEARLQKDKVYATVDGKDLQYDLARPAEGSGPFPLVIFLHAGGWQLGNKKSHDNFIQEMAERGYAGASINYRLAPDYKWPAQLDDVRQAVRYFRAHARELNIDPARIAVGGEDSGGHLALMLALLAAQEEKGVPLEKSDRVSAVINCFGPTDLRDWRVTSAWVETKIRIGFLKSSEQIIEDFLGTRDRTAPIYKEVSPISHVTPDAPPILTVIGSNDPLITLDQPKSFHEALKKAGVTEQLVIIDGGEHNGDSLRAGKADERIFEFLDKYLKNGKNNG